MDITISEGNQRKYLEESLDRKATSDELDGFEQYLANDISEWLKQNAKAYKDLRN